jgi:hypothetical protein
MRLDARLLRQLRLLRHRVRPTRTSAIVLAVVAAVGVSTSVAVATPASTAAKTPIGALNTVTATSTGFAATGWTLQSGNKSALVVRILVDGHLAGAVVAKTNRADVAHLFPAYGGRHGFSVAYALASGTHQVCASTTALKKTVSLGCKSISLTISPVGRIDQVVQIAGGVQAIGWTSDADSNHQPLLVSFTDNGRRIATTKTGVARPDVAHAMNNTVGPNSGFAIVLRIGGGTHRICATALNVGAGTNHALGCRSVAMHVNPFGTLNAVPRPAGSKSITVSGWAADPYTSHPVSVLISVDNGAPLNVVANAHITNLVTPYQGMGNWHGYNVTIPVNNAAHQICVTAVNIASGVNQILGCQTSAAMTATLASAPQQVSASTGHLAARVNWAAPANLGNTPVTGYIITTSPGGAQVTVGATATTAVITGLVAGRAYTFTVTAVNLIGNSATSAVTNSVTVLAGSTVATPGPVTTPALISTSRYVRDINGSASDTAKTYAMGTTDAGNNPANHAYLTLLQIGGQTPTGVVLSATSTFVSYAATLTAMKAYVDGYHHSQNSNAPVILAIGTNNDMDVNASTGAIWANSLIDPLASYAAQYPNITIAGANDIEPGFIGSVAATKSWVSGFLAATSAQFVFNGSADGCGWTRTGTDCNNGWSMAALQWMSGGAAPGRILSLPQIYNTTMPIQWKYISLTGVVAGAAKVNFAGPLTEYTACVQQTHSCGSIPNNLAWTALWTQLQSDSRIAQSSLPYGTDLRVN